jgi:hypothetical protein
MQELEVHLDGPGWYWIDFEEGDFQLHQQVPFELGADIVGGVRFVYSGGVASFWFSPTREPEVTVEVSTELELQGSTLWGSVLRRIPFVPIDRMTAERLSKSAASAFAAQIQRGVTVTYEPSARAKPRAGCSMTGRPGSRTHVCSFRSGQLTYSGLWSRCRSLSTP